MYTYKDLDECKLSNIKIIKSIIQYSKSFCTKALGWAQYKPAMFLPSFLIWWSIHFSLCTSNEEKSAGFLECATWLSSSVKF